MNQITDTASASLTPWTPDPNLKWDVVFDNLWEYRPALRGVTLQQIRDHVDGEFADAQVRDEFFDLDFYDPRQGIPIYASYLSFRDDHLLARCYLSK